MLVTIALCYFLTPSVCSTILLMAALAGTLIPLPWFAPGIRLLTVFFIGFFFAQYIFNILNQSVDVCAGVRRGTSIILLTLVQTETTNNVGLIRRDFENEWLYWGAQALVLFSYAIYSYSSYLPKASKNKQVIADGK